MNIIGIVIDFKCCLHVAGQFDQRPGLEHDGQGAGRRVPGGVAGDRHSAPPQNGFRAEQQRSGGNVIVAGNDRNLADLRAMLRQDIKGIDRVLGGGNGFVLRINPGRIHSLIQKPFRHFAGFRGGGIIGRRAAAGADDNGAGILLRSGQKHLEPLHQLIPHRSVRVQLEAQGHQTQGVVLRQIVRKSRVHRHRGFPQIHDPRPSISRFGIKGSQLIQGLGFPSPVSGMGNHQPLD